jgi:hypothetical protein
MNAKLVDEIADRAAEERSENEGMPEHPAKAHDPVRWGADRRARVTRRRTTPRHTGMFGVAFVSCAALAAFASARGPFRWLWHKGGGAARLPR